MISEFTKSINSVLHERVTSPLFGALAISWGIWNWKIIYLTLFVSNESIDVTKIEYITNNYSDIHHIITYPVISTILLLTVVPFFTNGAYWLHLKFNKWKTDKKHKVEMSQLLTFEQSIQLRTEISQKEKEFDSLLSRKNSEIEQFKLQIDSLTSSKQVPLEKTVSDENYSEALDFDSKINGMADKINQNIELNSALDTITERIQNGYAMGETVEAQSLAYFSTNGLIKHLGSGIYEFTDLGEKVHKVLLDKKYSNLDY